MNENRVYVTGLGAVTPIGIGKDVFWKNLLSGSNGIKRITKFNVNEYSAKLAGEVDDFNAEEWVDPKVIRRVDRFVLFALVAVKQALLDSGLEPGKFDPNRAGVFIGSGIGGSQSIEDGFLRLYEKGPGGVSPFFVSRILINMAASNASILNNLKGPMSSYSVACSTGSNVIGDAFRVIQRGDAEIMIAGSTEASITPLSYAGFCATRSMSVNEDPDTASRPFDLNRDGFVMGEGAGIVVLESEEHALKRNARIYAEITGYGNTSDAYHITAPDPSGDGMIRVMKKAIEDAKINKEEIGYINAHGTSTKLNDKCESNAIENVFGEHSKNLKVSSNKSMIGHLMAAAGAVEFIATVLSIFEGKIPPTINYKTPDPECRLDYVINGSEKINVNAAMSNSFGFGGGNACLVVKRIEN
ncbi:MAG: beta-ketoacyl-ACP synthase II [bacterium]|nr:beta-ketoacyl-ACP synthase II [bacterium]